MVLSDLGAEVIKIEPAGGEGSRRMTPLVRGQSLYFAAYNRGKKSLCLDLRSEQGKQIFAQLAAKADVVLENFRPGVIDAMGFGYEALRALNPKIILVSVSAFGQTGSRRKRPGFDPLGQAMSGLMWLTGKALGQPVGTASSIVDRVTALHAAIGTLAALRHRDRTGEGQVVDVCLMDSALTLVEIPLGYQLSTGEEGGEDGRPPIPCKDGYVVMSGLPRMWQRLMERIGAPVADGEGSGHVLLGRSDARLKVLREWSAGRSVAEVCATLEELDIPVAPVMTIPEVAADPCLGEREMMVKSPDALAGELFLPGTAIKMSKTPGRVEPISTPGQHTDELLGELLGFDRDKLQQLRTDGVIA
jgi:crotonobetainyl-CoA:carnitine CoA-transferase CaiB-like acyl-CoA transferase